MDSHWGNIAILIEDYGITMSNQLTGVYYYDRNDALLFYRNHKNGKYYDADGKKFYNREFKLYLKKLVRRLEDLTAFF